MKLCRFWKPGAGASIGAVTDGMVHDLTSADPNQFGSFSALVANVDLCAKVRASLPRTSKSGAYRWDELDVAPDMRKPHLLAPLTKQEVWAAGVTYLRSREARMEESAGGGSFYDKVYYAERPELFFKATPNRVAGPNAGIRIRKDSKWNVPEPEIALVVGPERNLVGFTIGNDVSSRDIEGENPLYLPQAKVYLGSCALGPALLLAESVTDVRSLSIHLRIRRGTEPVFDGSTSVAKMKRTFEELIAFLYREQEFPCGAILLTGTGVVPPDDFTLLPGDVVEITIPEIGTLRNPVL